MPLLCKLTTYAGFIAIRDYKRKRVMYIENSMSSLGFFVGCSNCSMVDVNDGNCTCRVF